MFGTDDTGNWDGKSLNIGGVKVAVLGDTHLGRTFTNDVPLHRRGDRERDIHAYFEGHFDNLPSDITYHVMMGDIFDKEIVPPTIVKFVADVYREASDRFPLTTFILLRGNHDATRDLERATSFDLLAMILRGLGVAVVDTEPYLTGDMAFVPWHPIITAEEMVKDVGKVQAAFGHWDVDVRNELHNIIPKMDTQLYVTGHDHKRRIEERHGVPVLVTGAMVPLAHGEDWTGQTYRTLTLEALKAVPESEIRQCCVRVILAPGEELPEIDAYSVAVMKAKPVEEDVGEVSLDGLDMGELFREVLTSHGVNAELSSEVYGKYQGRST